MAKIVKNLDTVAQQIAAVQTEKIFVIYNLCEVISTIAREVEFDLKGLGQLNHSDKHSINQIKFHADRMSVGVGRVLSEEKAERFSLMSDIIKNMIYADLELPESTRDIVEG